MKKTISLIFFSFLVTVIYSQRIKGKVLDVSNQLPIEGVHVYLNSTSGTFTDINGKFNLRLDNKEKATDFIYFSHLGFILKKLTIKQFKEQKRQVYLDMNEVNLNEVTITSETKLKPLVKFKRLASMKTGMYGFDTFVKDDKIYVVGGDNSIEIDVLREAVDRINPEATLQEALRRMRLDNGSYYNKYLYSYDISKNKWEKEDTDLNTRAYHKVNFDKSTNKAYIIGGKRLSKNGIFEYLKNDIEILDLDNQTVTKDKTNPHQAANFSSFLYKGNLIVLGGSVKNSKKGKKTFTNKIHTLDLNTGLWYELGKMPIAKETSGVLVNDKIYLVGGNNNKSLKSIESYNLKTGKWERIGELFKESSKPALAKNENTIFIYDKNRIYTLDVKTHRIKEYYIAVDYAEPKMFYVNNKLYLLGGIKNSEYGKEPVSSFISIDLDEFRITRAHKEKRLSSL